MVLLVQPLQGPRFTRTPNNHLHRDGRLFKHTVSKCPKVTAQMKTEALVATMARANADEDTGPQLSHSDQGQYSKESTATPEGKEPKSKKRKHTGYTQKGLDTFIERPMSLEQKQKVDLKYLQ